MSSSRCFRLTLVLVVSLLVASGIAAGVTVSDHTAPSEAKVGSRLDASFTLGELYQNPSYEQWTLRTRTELENVTWTFKTINQAGDTVNTNSVDGQNASQSLDINSGVAQVEVSVTGTVPPVDNFSYDPAPTFVLAELTHARQGGTSSTIETFRTRHYTPDSQRARDAIDSAQSAIDAAGGNAQAQETEKSAISAYEGRNFDNAVSLAQRAQREANQAQQAQQRNQLILYGAIGVIVLVLVIAVAYWFVNRDTGGRL